MTVAIIITFCVLLLIAYAFDLTASRSKIPSVILLLLVGWGVRQITDWFEITVPDVSPVLPVLGTVGLILIVLEGALELELNQSKLAVVKKSFIGALMPMFALAFILGYLFHYYGHYGFKDSLTNAIPFCVISSAIAIPSVRNLPADQKEFVIYESSISDILGVLLFNFLALNDIITAQSFGDFALEILITIVISMVAIFILSFLMNNISHHVKFGPIILLIVLIYTICKIYHLPGLIFILAFGLAIGNIDELRRWKWLERFRLDDLKGEVKKFHELAIEGTFVIRALFFLVFGFLIKTSEVLNMDSLKWAMLIVVCIVILRAIQLKLSNIPLSPLLFVSPRGLITILLFLSLRPDQVIPLVNSSLIIQVIILTALLMMFGLMAAKPGENKIPGTPKR